MRRWSSAPPPTSLKVTLLPLWIASLSAPGIIGLTIAQALSSKHPNLLVSDLHFFDLMSLPGKLRAGLGATGLPSILQNLEVVLQWSSITNKGDRRRKNPLNSLCVVILGMRSLNAWLSPSAPASCLSATLLFSSLLILTLLFKSVLLAEISSLLKVLDVIFFSGLDASLFFYCGLSGITSTYPCWLLL